MVHELLQGQQLPVLVSRRFSYLCTPIVCAVLTSCGAGGSGERPPSASALNHAPTISSFVATTTSGAPPVSVRFSWAVSDPDGDSLSCQLDLGDGSGPAAISNCSGGSGFQYVYRTSGNFKATLAASDGHTGGTVTRSTNVILVAAGAVFLPNRTTVVRDDNRDGRANNQTAELPLRYLVYDAARKQIFVANRFLNRVEVFSTDTEKLVTSIPVPGPSFLDLSADGQRVYVGSLSAYVYAIDTTKLQVIERIPFTPADYAGTLPKLLVSTSTGKFLMVASDEFTSGGPLEEYDPVTQTYRTRTDLPPMHQVGMMRASPDHTKIVLGGDDSGGQLVLYDAVTDSFTSTASAGGIPWSLSVDRDGSRWAAATTFGVITIFDGNLRALVTQNVGNAVGCVLSPDGNLLYVFSASFAPSVQVYRTSDLSLVGAVPDIFGNAYARSFPQDIDDSGIIFGLVDRSVVFLDVSQPTNLPASQPVLTLLQPTSGAPGTSTEISAQLQAPNGTVLPSPTSIFLGRQNVPLLSFSSNTISTSTPANVDAGVVDFRAFFPDGWYVIAPEAYSYGPHAVINTVDGGPAEGGVLDLMIGYGFSSDATARVGGSLGQDLGVKSGSGISPFPFPMDRLGFTVPPGVIGPADITLSTANGTTTLKNAFHYYSQKRAPLFGNFYAMLLDSSRHRLYLTDGNQIRVVSTDSLLEQTPIRSTAFSQSLRGMAMTPDNSRLLVADNGGDQFFSINADSPSDIKQYHTAVVGDQAGSDGPVAVAATNTNKVFVYVGFAGDGCKPNIVREVDLITGQITPRNEMSQLPCYDGGSHMMGRADGTAVYWNMLGGGMVWTSASDTFHLLAINAIGDGDLDVATDGTREFAGGKIADASLYSESPLADLDIDALNFPLVSSPHLDASGSLLYYPMLFGLEIFDANTGGLLRRYLTTDSSACDPLRLAGPENCAAVEPDGTRAYLLTVNGITSVELDSIPLGLGNVLPRAGVSGTSVTIRGTGFMPGINVQIDGTRVNSTWLNSQTLQIQLPQHATGTARITLVNPNGEQYSRDAALTFQ